MPRAATCYGNPSRSILGGRTASPLFVAMRIVIPGLTESPAFPLAGRAVCLREGLFGRIGDRGLSRGSEPDRGLAGGSSGAARGQGRSHRRLRSLHARFRCVGRDVAGVGAGPAGEAADCRWRLAAAQSFYHGDSPRATEGHRSRGACGTIGLPPRAIRRVKSPAHPVSTTPVALRGPRTAPW